MRQHQLLGLWLLMQLLAYIGYMRQLKPHNSFGFSSLKAPAVSLARHHGEITRPILQTTWAWDKSLRNQEAFLSNDNARSVDSDGRHIAMCLRFIEASLMSSTDVYQICLTQYSDSSDLTPR